MTDPRLLQDDSPDIAAQVRAATANSAYVPENEYDNANPGPSRPMTGLLGTSDPEIAAVRDYGKLAPGVAWHGGLAAASHSDEQYAEEMRWRRDQDDRQSKAAALEAATCTCGIADAQIVVKAAKVFEAYLRGETKIEPSVVGECADG